MAYTLLRVTDRGVVLFDYHARRFEDAVGFTESVRELSAGVWAVRAGSDGFHADWRPGSRLRDGIATRVAVSPMTSRRGLFAKPPSPNPYDGVRERGIATLLTSTDGTEILEACSAAVLGWDGTRFVVVPHDRPRVWSTAETAVREHLPVIERPLLLVDDVPLLLINAVIGTCAVPVPGRPSFREDVRAEVDRLFERLTR